MRVLVTGGADFLGPYVVERSLHAGHDVTVQGDVRAPLDNLFAEVRPANLYGPGQTTEGEGAVIPTFLGRFLRGLSPVIHGDGPQTRVLLYVRDMALALEQALHHVYG